MKFTYHALTHEGELYASMNYTIIVLENGLSSIRRQDIFCTHAGLCLCWGKFQCIGIKLQQFSYKKSILK